MCWCGAQQFGDLRTLYTACKDKGWLLITYYNIYAAKLAKNTLHGQCLYASPLEVHYEPSKEGKDLSEGARRLLIGLIGQCFPAADLGMHCMRRGCWSSEEKVFTSWAEIVTGVSPPVCGNRVNYVDTITSELLHAVLQRR